MAENYYLKIDLVNSWLKLCFKCDFKQNLKY